MEKIFAEIAFSLSLILLLLPCSPLLPRRRANLILLTFPSLLFPGEVLALQLQALLLTISLSIINSSKFQARKYLILIMGSPSSKVAAPKNVNGLSTQTNIF